MSVEDIGDVVAQLLQAELDDGLGDASCARAQTLQDVETVSGVLQQRHNDGKCAVREVPEIDEVTLRLHEYGLLYLHLYFDDLCLQIAINFMLVLFDEFLYIGLTEDKCEIVLVRYLKGVCIKIEVVL
jgi:hypothetical protein